MSGNSYMALAYVAGLGLFWGYAASVWRTARALDRHARTVAAPADRIKAAASKRRNDTNRGERQ